MAGPTETERRRLRWRCRRGLKELDVLFERYAETALASASAAELGSLERFLDLPDPEIAAYLLGEAVPEDPALAALAASIRNYAARA